MSNIICSLLVEGLGLNFEAHPLFNDDLKLKLQPEENQVFKRSSLDGTIKFIGTDFDFLTSCDESIKFTLKVNTSGYLVGTQDFYLTDCTLDYDNKIASLKLSLKDRYEKLLNGLSNEYNLVKLAPKAKQISYRIFSALQLYTRGDTKITTVFSSGSYEQDCNVVDTYSELITKYHFSRIGYLSAFTIKSTEIADSSLADAAGTYNLTEIVVDIFGTPFQGYTNTNGKYKLYLLNNTSGNSARAYFETVASGARIEAIQFSAALSDGILYAFVNNNTGSALFYFTYHEAGDLYGRIVSPIQYSPLATNELDPANDICTDLGNFKYCGGYSDVNILTSKVMSSEPTEYGINSIGEYFTAPSLTSQQKTDGDRLVPVSQSYWESMSFFIDVTPALVSKLNSLYEQVKVKDTYYLADAIRVLLAEIDSSIKFEIDSDAFSNFLNIKAPDKENPILGYDFPRSRGNILCIAPITNIKKTNYEQAAQKGDISLEQIFTMLRDIYQVYWYIDEMNNLHIEQLVYFRNGLSYIEDFEQYDTDLTKYTCNSAKQMWSYGLNSIEYKVDNLPARYEFGFSNPASEVFNGYAVDIKDAYLSKSSTKKIDISSFVTDLNMLVTFPSQFGDDLYVLAEVTNTTLGMVPTATIRLASDTPKFVTQNVYASLLFAQMNYYKDSFSGYSAFIGDKPLIVESVEPIRKQKLTFPAKYNNKIKDTLRIKSELGVGGISDFALKLGSDSCETNILIPAENKYMKYITTKSAVPGVTSISNNSNKLLAVTYLRYSSDGVVVGTSMALIPAKSFVTNSSGLRIKILKVIDKSLVDISRSYTRSGMMGFTHNASALMQIIEILGNNVGYLDDWAYERIYARVPVSITIKASTEDGFDFGYISRKPIQTVDMVTEALVSVTGEEEKTYSLKAGESVFIGYVKDIEDTAGDDKVTFTIKRG